MTDLEAARAKRWGYSGKKIVSFDRVSEWIDGLGFALLWPRANTDVPVLWAIGSNDGTTEWGPDAERMWRWKDELPKRRRAWYGHFLFGRKSFLSIPLVADLYPRSGTPDDFHDAEFSKDARKIADVILTSGPTSSAALREATNLRGPEYDKALRELGRALVITHFGVEEQGAGWPSAVLELTVRAFKIKPSTDRVRAAGRFLGTALETKPAVLARAFNWAAADARETLDALIEQKKAEKEGSISRASAALLRR